MLKIGIIGCGKITEVRHAPEYSENPDCEITALYNPTTEKAAALAQKYGGRVCQSVEELLASDVDAVSVCTANRFHAAMSIQALEAGKHVLCEKPMATTLEDCLNMVAAAEKQGLNLSIGLNQRLARAHVKAKELLDSGEMGEVLTFETHFSHPGPEGWTGKADSWFFDKKTASFGVMADLGVHKTDLICYLTDQKIVRTAAVLSTVDKRYPDGSLIDVDDNAMALYTLESGVTGIMKVSWTNYGTEDNSTKIYCKNGVVRMYDDPRYSLIVEKRDGTVVPYELDKLTSNKEQTTGGRTSTGVIDEFVSSILEKRESRLSGKSALTAMKVLFANQRSSESGKTENVD